MTKAEKFAYKIYPKNRKGCLYDLGRNSIIQGYEQAQKDLALSLDDIKLLDELLSGNVKIDQFFGSDEWYNEILRLFNDRRK